MNDLPPELLGILPLVAVLLAGVAGGFWPARWLPDFDRWLGSRATPWVIGATTSSVILYIWGSLDAVPVIHDEAAYLLQAAMIAHGHLVAPPPPLPEFFEQMHVFVTPVFAARYPPGFAMALVPGIWLGLPGLMPVLMSGLTGALLFALARRLTTNSVALLACLIWIVTPGNLRFRPYYLTESLSGLLWLATWWSLLEWRRTERLGWLLAISALTGWQAMTRPLTAIAFALPLGACVLLTTYRSRRWRDLLLAAGLGALCLSIIPYQNRVTTGDWRLTPLKHYSTVYTPFNLPGFGLDSTPAQRPLPADFKAFTTYESPMHREFTPDRLPEFFVQRGGHVLYDTWGHWRSGFTVLGVIGIACGGSELLFGVATCLLLLLGYLGFAHAELWTIYYLETETVLQAAVAIGAWWMIRRIVSRCGVAASEAPDRLARRASLALALLSVAALGTWSHPINSAETLSRHGRLYQEAFRDRVAGLPGPSIVFIRYSPTHEFHRSLIANEADLARARAWLVYDRGVENARLIALAPDRTPYLYLEQKKLLVRLNPDGTPAASPASGQ